MGRNNYQHSRNKWQKLIEAGMNVAHQLSRGSHEEHLERFQQLRGCPNQATGQNFVPSLGYKRSEIILTTYRHAIDLVKGATIPYFYC